MLKFIVFLIIMILLSGLCSDAFIYVFYKEFGLLSKAGAAELGFSLPSILLAFVAIAVRIKATPSKRSNILDDF